MIRENINTLDFKLKNYFDNVTIKEKSEKQSFEEYLKSYAKKIFN